jgi:hypothetical protein
MSRPKFLPPQANLRPNKATLESGWLRSFAATRTDYATSPYNLSSYACRPVSFDQFGLLLWPFIGPRGAWQKRCNQIPCLASFNHVVNNLSADM